MKKKCPQVVIDCVKYAWHDINIPYDWGGDSPILIFRDDFGPLSEAIRDEIVQMTGGYDCSGFVVELLKCGGVLREHEDYTAHGLMTEFWQYKVDEPLPGCLAFKTANARAYHVGFVVSSVTLIHAAGGGSTCETVKAAYKLEAFIKPRPIFTGDNVIYIDPFKPARGLQNY